MQIVAYLLMLCMSTEHASLGQQPVQDCSQEQTQGEPMLKNIEKGDIITLCMLMAAKVSFD